MIAIYSFYKDSDFLVPFYRMILGKTPYGFRYVISNINVSLHQQKHKIDLQLVFIHNTLEKKNTDLCL